MKKKLMLTIVAVMVAILILACAGAAKPSGSAKIKGVYLSPAKADYSNMRPTYNFYLYNYAQSEITLYEDGTYQIIVSDATFSAVVLDESTNDHTENERTNSITKLFGTYTSAPNDLDEDLTDVTLSQPTRLIRSFDQQYYVDTDNWTDAMGKAVADKQSDETGAIVGYGDPLTAAEYLAKMTFTGTKTVQVNEKLCSFDFDNFGVPTGFAL